MFTGSLRSRYFLFVISILARKKVNTPVQLLKFLASCFRAIAFLFIHKVNQVVEDNKLFDDFTVFLVFFFLAPNRSQRIILYDFYFLYLIILLEWRTFRKKCLVCVVGERKNMILENYQQMSFQFTLLFYAYVFGGSQ